MKNFIAVAELRIIRANSRSRHIAITRSTSRAGGDGRKHLQMIGRALAALIALLAAPAVAEPLRDLCPTRPGLGTAPCIIDKGHAIAELGFGWTLEKDESSRTDSFALGNLLVRYGLDDVGEIQAGWTAYGHVRVRDKATGKVTTANGAGDVAFAYKRSLTGPSNGSFALAVQPFVVVPTGRSLIGSGQWDIGLLMPMSLDLGERFQLQSTPNLDMIGDEDGGGRHLAFGDVVGLGVEVAKEVSLTVELAAFRDQDPSGHSTALLAAASAAWQPGRYLQLDVGGAFGLNQSSPDAHLYFGVSRRF